MSAGQIVSTNQRFRAPVGVFALAAALLIGGVAGAAISSFASRANTAGTATTSYLVLPNDRGDMSSSAYAATHPLIKVPAAVANDPSDMSSSAYWAMHPAPAGIAPRHDDMSTAAYKAMHPAVESSIAGWAILHPGPASFTNDPALGRSNSSATFQVVHPGTK